MKKICVITGARSEYGLLKCVMRGIQNSSDLDLQLIVTGMHLSAEFGLTYREIERDGFEINKKIEMLISSDTSLGIANSMGLGMIGFANVLDELKPDLILVLGDRFELLSFVSVATIFRIPVAHLHGGEITEGAIDESVRHSITKMSHLHFVATDEYKNRVIQLGEFPKNVFNVGGLGIDNINNIDLLDLEKLQELLKFKFGKKNLLVTYHPVTLEKKSTVNELNELLLALDELKDTKVIFTMPNADMGNRKIINKIKKYVNKNINNCIFFTSLGQLKYLSCIMNVDAVVGNSSSGIIEAPTFKKGTINIGSRQKGRIKAESIIDCLPEKKSILRAFDKLYSKKFQKKLLDVKNPYGVGGASDKIIKILKTINLNNIIKKKFYDIRL